MAKQPDDKDPEASAPDNPEAQPPDERFWVKYSPHHELPVSGASSVGLHALVIGLILLVGFLVSQARQHRSQPPLLDAVEVPEDGPGGNGANGKRGETDAPKQETVGSPQAKQVGAFDPAKPDPKLATPVANERPLDLFAPPDSPDSDTTVERLRAIEREVGAAMNTPAKGSPKGVPGGDGPRKDKDRGSRDSAKKPGPGPSGQPLTQQQRREMRWRIDFSGSPAEHLRKLKALNITFAVPTRQTGIYLLFDLTRDPPATKKDNLAAYLNRVKWFNSHRQSLQGIMPLLGLKELPRFAVIFLPEEMEDEMRRLEEAYQGRREDEIQLTEFEIRRQGDGYRPVVVRQVPRTGP
jgi:hypothetical protein